MQARFLPLFIPLFLFASACSTGRFQSIDEFSQWTERYYERPQPDRLVESLAYYLSSPLFTNAKTRTPALYFFANAARDKDLSSEIFRVGAERKEDDAKFFCFSILWLDGTDSSLNLLRDYVKAGPEGELRDGVEALLYEPPANPLDGAAVSAADIDVLWASFYATGDANYIEKLIYVAGAADQTTEMKDFILGTAARKSLVDIARKQKAVLAILKTEAELETDEKKFVRGILRDVTEAKD